MNVLIIEDEPQAARRMETLMKELEPTVNIVGKIDSVKKAVQWISDNPPPDLILMDIQLADGISFSIFEKCHVQSPVIFTTAYDEYALKAFKVNSIDYILKPVDKEELSAALTKFKNMKRTAPDTKLLLDNIGQAVQMLTKRYKSRFMIKVGEHLKTIETANLLYFYSQDKATFCYTVDNRSLILDYTLEQLEEMTDPTIFFRVNRKYLVSATSISDIISYTNSRLKLKLKGSTDDDIIVARERVQDFKEWLDR
jgi:DNA-binding LytR/AlgR family response regulator